MLASREKGDLVSGVKTAGTARMPESWPWPSPRQAVPVEDCAGCGGGGGGVFFVFTVMRWYMVMKFKDTVQSVFSSAYLEGRPVEGWDHQVHT